MDPNGNVIVLSVVYDGAPEAGKTTSVRALARSVGREVYTPEEINGRTVFFDWMEYTGGRFEGAPIRCQIASVPGQRRWVRRRAVFLDRADVIIFVGDTSSGRWRETMERLRELRQQIDGRAGAPVGIVFQANKRDRPDALDIETVREELHAHRIAVVESVAHEGVGIREAFVLGVRLALDRVREEQQRGTLQQAAPAFARGEEILEGMLMLDRQPEPSPEALATTVVRVGGPRPPSPNAPSGVIWPPVDGRVILHEIASLGVQTSVTAIGDCVAGLGTAWRIHSRADAVYRELDEGRAALVVWARLHASLQGALSKPRCIVLAETGDGQWRLWQIVKTQPSLRELCGESLRARDPLLAVRGFAAASRLLLEAQRACQSVAVSLPCTIDAIGANGTERPIFVGLMPRGAATAAPDDGLHELASLFGDRSARERAELRAALSAHAGEFTFQGGAQASQLLAERLGA
jgi:signal recognition particle receptor subunit beta